MKIFFSTILMSLFLLSNVYSQVNRSIDTWTDNISLQENNLFSINKNNIEYSFSVLAKAVINNKTFDQWDIKILIDIIPEDGNTDRLPYSYQEKFVKLDNSDPINASDLIVYNTLHHRMEFTIPVANDDDPSLVLESISNRNRVEFRFYYRPSPIIFEKDLEYTSLVIDPNDLDRFDSILNEINAVENKFKETYFKNYLNNN